MPIKQCGCGGEMEKGILNQHGMIWFGKFSSLSHKFFKFMSGPSSKRAFAYKCKSCGKIDLYAEE